MTRRTLMLGAGKRVFVAGNGDRPPCSNAAGLSNVQRFNASQALERREGTPGVARGWEGLAAVPCKRLEPMQPLNRDPAGDTPDPTTKPSIRALRQHTHLQHAFSSTHVRRATLCNNVVTMGNGKKPWYHRGPHQQTSLHLRNAWTKDPTVRCAHCGLTLDEGYKKWGINARWEADHITPGAALGYQPAHAHCNRSHGATIGNTQRNRKHSSW